MSIKNILIHVDDSKQVDGRLDVAVGLARTHDAHLAAIYAIPDPFISLYADDGYIPADVTESKAAPIQIARVFMELHSRVAQPSWRLQTSASDIRWYIASPCHTGPEPTRPGFWRRQD